MSDQWRLLNEGEQVQLGDEVQNYKNEWTPVSFPGGVASACPLTRRRIAEQPGWIPISKRKPEFPCAIGGRTDSGVWCWQKAVVKSELMHPSWTHWCPLPEPPMSEDEKEWEKWIAEKGNIGEIGRVFAKEAFLAGLQRGRKQ